ncbi:MAG: dihydrodipicolinate synthase family protein [Betaproteobacteria bacterium]|nr:dihydrodipicolinate synthase family protein [Betaproteobacteria bacterium]
MSNNRWIGVFPASVLPFREDFEIDEPEFRKLLAWLISVKGVTGVVVNGHVGEIAHLTPEERVRVSAIAVEHVSGASRVVTGISAEGSREAAQMARDARAVGVDGLLVMPPHRWLRKGKSREETLGFFQAIADAADLPIIIHQYPAVTKATYDAETLVALGEIPQVVSVKFGTRDFSRYERQVRELRQWAPHITILTCHDEYIFSSALVGVDGAILGFASFVPELITQLLEAVWRDDWPTARRLNDKLYLLKLATYGGEESCLYNHATLKEAMVMIGRLKNARVRPPVPPLSAAERQRIRDLLEQAGLLPAGDTRPMSAKGKEMAQI